MKLDAREADRLFGEALQSYRGGRYDEAVARYRAVLALAPYHARAHHHLGSLAVRAGQPMAGLTHFKVALQANAWHGDYWASYVDALARAGLAEPARQMLAHAQARGLAPELVAQLARQLPGATFGGVSNPVPAPATQILARLATLGRARHFAEMESLAGALTMREPANGAAWLALGTAILEQGGGVEAYEPLCMAVAILPGNADAHESLGTACVRMGEFALAETCFRHALASAPNVARTRSNLLFVLNYTADASSATRLAEAREYGQRATESAGMRHSSWHCGPPGSDAERLRVGLVSGDLVSHPVGHFLESLLGQLDPRRVELFAYSTNDRTDELTERIRPRLTAWRSIANRDDADAAATIHADGIHVLIDLAGHTAANRLAVFAQKPAPVQVSWLGYFATTGVQEIDYLLADHVGLPASLRAQFTEKIHYLPDTRLCFTPPREAPEVAPLPALKNGYVTFGCFQQLSKLQEPVLAAWARVLAAVPESRLRVQSPPLAADAVRHDFARRLATQGIDPARADLFAGAPRGDYLAAHAEVDIILDTFPYPGGTTTCEALWMGVPTMTLAGDSLLARQGASLLAAAGLSDWIAETTDGYVSGVVARAADLASLSVLRTGLREQVAASPLFDAPRFARHFEAALMAMWRAAGGDV